MSGHFIVIAATATAGMIAAGSTSDLELDRLRSRATRMTEIGHVNSWTGLAGASGQPSRNRAATAGNAPYSGHGVRFEYPAAWHIDFNSQDPIEPGLWLVRLSSPDQHEFCELRFGTSNLNLVELGSHLMFNVRRRYGSFYPMQDYPKERFNAGDVHTEWFHKDMNGSEREFIGSTIRPGGRTIAHIAYVFDRSRVRSMDARILIMETFAFIDGPSLAGEWGRDGLRLTLKADGSYERYYFYGLANRRQNQPTRDAGRYEITGNQITFRKQYGTGPETQTCRYSLTAGQLTICGDTYSVR